MQFKILLLVTLVALACCRKQIPWNNGVSQSEDLTLCSNPQFRDCPDVFIQIFDPKFCALKTDGTWQSYTFECQACQNPDVIGFEDGECIDGRPPSEFQSEPVTYDPSCAAVTCLVGTTCRNGRCLKDNSWSGPTCATIRCMAGTICIDGECIPDDRQDFSCANVLCPLTSSCQNGRCVRMNFCLSENQCRRGQTCLRGKCVDLCALRRCIGGQCINGRCLQRFGRNYW